LRPSRPTEQPGPPHTGARRRVLCVGAATVDRSFRSLDPIRPGTSNPVVSTKGFGGVARNVAENLARLGALAAALTVECPVSVRPDLSDELLASAMNRLAPAAGTIR
jgi:hypothetical protein